MLAGRSLAPFLAPAMGSIVVARGDVLKFGRIITACSGAIKAVQEGREYLIATMLAALMTVCDCPTMSN